MHGFSLIYDQGHAEPEKLHRAPTADLLPTIGSNRLDDRLHEGLFEGLWSAAVRSGLGRTRFHIDRNDQVGDRIRHGFELGRFGAWFVLLAVGFYVRGVHAADDEDRDQAREQTASRHGSLRSGE